MQACLKPSSTHRHGKLQMDSPILSGIQVTDLGVGQVIREILGGGSLVSMGGGGAAGVAGARLGCV